MEVETDLTPSNQGQYRRKGKKEESIKIHVAVNIKTRKVPSLIITDDKSSR